MPVIFATTDWNRHCNPVINRVCIENLDTGLMQVLCSASFHHAANLNNSKATLAAL